MTKSISIDPARRIQAKSLGDSNEHTNCLLISLSLLRSRCSNFVLQYVSIIAMVAASTRGINLGAATGSSSEKAVYVVLGVRAASTPPSPSPIWSLANA